MITITDEMVDRLRKPMSRDEFFKVADGLCNEAADEILRLRKALGDLMADLQHRAVTLPNGTKQVAVSDGVYHRALAALATVPPERAALTAALAVAPAEPTEIRHEEGGYVEFLNEDVPTVVREIDGRVAILTTLEKPRRVVGYRVHDPGCSPAEVFAVAPGERTPSDNVAGSLTPEGYVSDFIDHGEKSTRKLDSWEQAYQDAGLIEEAANKGYIWIGRDVACTIEVTAHGRTAAEVHRLRQAKSALDAANARVAELEAQVAFTLSDTSRLLRKDDVTGACPHPDDCFYESDRVRCGPCAVKASAAKGVAIDDTRSHLPEVGRLRREVKDAEARIEELTKWRDEWKDVAAEMKGLVEQWEARATKAEELLKEAVKVLEPFAHAASRAENAAAHFKIDHAEEVPDDRPYGLMGTNWGHLRAARSLCERMKGDRG